MAGKRRDIGLGGYPPVSPKAARAAVRAAKEKAATGVDPIDEKQGKVKALAAERHARAEAEARSFRAVALAYIRKEAPGWKNERTASLWQALLERYAFEVLLVEALRAAQAHDPPPGLLRGLADQRISAAIRQMHASPAKAWTVAEFARSAAMSRSAFFERFSRVVGLPPMEYLLSWRMAVAKDLLRSGRLAVSEIAERVGYTSSSTFSTAFAKHVGLPPARYARAIAESTPQTTFR